MSTHSIDSKLTAIMANVSEIPQSAPEPVEQKVEEIVPQRTLDPSNEPEKQEVAPELPDKTDETPQEPTKSVEIDSKSVETGKIDEYGNPVEPPKTYTEEEVQRILRERIARAKFQDQPQPTQQQVKQTADNFQADPNSDESWETQLEAFVEKTIDKRQSKQAEQQWREQEQAKQAEFEAKFNTGMNKYSDFNEVVRGKPITDSMMMAARNLDNPAAFVYGAAKLHPQELSRIAAITDPYAQAAEVGRLHERMVKARNGVSAAPKPIDPVKGDIVHKKIDERPPIDQLIANHAKQKQQRR